MRLGKYSSLLKRNNCVKLLSIFRIANDGLESIYPLIGDCRKVHIPNEDLITLLTNNDPQNSPPIASLSKTIQDQVEHLSK